MLGLGPPWRLSKGTEVRALQHALYRAAKADPDRRFHALRDKVYREDVLQRAWYAVRRNNGAPGIDKTTLADVEEYGVSRLLGELRAGTWRPLPARKVLIPKPGSAERRPLTIAAVRDRIVQAADRARAGLRGGFPDVQFRGSAPGGPRIMPCRCSLMSPGRGGGGCWRRTSRTACRDSARDVDAGGRGTHQRPGRLDASAGDAARTGGEPGDGASNGCCYPRTTWA